MMIALEGASQVIDTTGKVWIPRPDALGTLARIERLKADSAELVRKSAEVSDLVRMNDSKTISIRDLTTHVQTQDIRIQGLINDNKLLERGLKKQKRKTMLATISGIIGSGGLAYLFIIK